MRTRLLSLLTAMLGMSFCANAQQSPCSTDQVNNRLKQEHPEIATYEAQLEQAVQAGMQHINLSRFAKTTIDTTTYDVPIVIHVVHDYGAEYLDDNSILEAVKVWAAIYVKQNADTTDVIAPFKPWIGNPRIRLHLATKDPSGNPTRGITHHQSYLTYNADDQAKLDQWPPNQYINIWFIRVFGASATGAAAYAYLPQSAAVLSYWDGVIGLYDYLNYDKAIPHEIGHVLNLQHPWGNTNQPGVACGDDQVDDTPPTKGHNPVGCVASALYDTTCATHYMKSYTVGTVTTIIDYPDTTNAQNIMDYTYCQRMFTKGQVDRMRLSLTNTVAGRNNLYSAANLAATGALAVQPDLAPTADFSVEKGNGVLTTERSFFLCSNAADQFQFRNRSWNDTVTGVQWTFSNGATNPTPNTTIVLNRFTQPGWVSVSITATGNNTGSNTLTNTHAVYVADTAVAQPSGYLQKFTPGASLDQWPMFNYYNNAFQWQAYTGAGYDDNYSLRYLSFDSRTSPANKTGTPVGDYDDVFTTGFDLSNYSTGALNMNFYSAGSAKTGTATANDSLQISASIDCGVSWHQVGLLTGSTLANNAKQAAAFVPTSKAQWLSQTLSLPTAYRSAKTFFRLRYKPGDLGNNLYLDNFGLSQYSTEVTAVTKNPDLVTISPNPSSGDTRLVFETGTDGRAAYSIRDITGKLVYHHEAVFAGNTIVEQTLAGSLFPAPGLYMVSITIADKTVTKKLVIE